MCHISDIGKVGFVPMIERHEIVALERLIHRLRSTARQSIEQAKKKRQAYIEKAFNTMLDTGKTLGQAAEGLDHLALPESEFRAHLKKIAGSLEEQVKITDTAIGLWFEHGQYPPPYYPWRITVILRKEKLFDVEKEFLTAYCRHFVARKDMAKRLMKIGAFPFDDQSVLLQSTPTVAFLEIKIDNHHPGRGSNSTHFNFSFKCEVCGGDKIRLPDGATDESLVTCPSCAVPFGKMSSIKARAKVIGEAFLSR